MAQGLPKDRKRGGKWTETKMKAEDQLTKRSEDPVLSYSLSLGGFNSRCSFFYYQPPPILIASGYVVLTAYGVNITGDFVLFDHNRLWSLRCGWSLRW